MKPVAGFLGLNNVADPLRLGLRWLTTADNVLIDRAGAIDRRSGYGERAISGAISGAFATEDASRFYLIIDGDLVRVNPDLTTTLLRAGLGSAPMHWAEINEQVWYSNGPDKGVIYANDEVRNWGWPEPGMPQLVAIAGDLPAGLYRVACTFRLPDGRETGSGDASALELTEGQALQISEIPQQPGCRTRVYIAPANSEVFGLAAETTLQAFTWNSRPEALGRELVNHLLAPPPQGAVQVAFWRGRACLMEFDAQALVTRVWMSKPLAFHLFDLEADHFAVPGRGTMLVDHDDALLVGTDGAIWAYGPEGLSQLAGYGVVPGWPAHRDEQTGQVYFWSQRGVCRALPFENLIESRISVAPGTQVGAAILRRDGSTTFVASLHAGGTAHNPQS